MTNRETQVLIVGAGPTGLALACDLGRRGVNFRIVDKSPEYFIGSKGKGLQPRSLEVMDDFGIVDEILASGKFHIPFRGYDGTHGVNEMHRYTRAGGKQPAEVFDAGTLGEGMRAAMRQIETSYEAMIASWRQS